MENVEHLTLLPLFEELRGERVVVRPYRIEDAEALKEAVEESREHLEAVDAVGRDSPESSRKVGTGYYA